jgi:hypothetical protein
MQCHAVRFPGFSTPPRRVGCRFFARTGERVYRTEKPPPVFAKRLSFGYGIHRMHQFHRARRGRLA